MVYHVLRDGTVTNDITGRVVKIEDAEPVYRLLASLRVGTSSEKEAKNESKKRD